MQHEQGPAEGPIGPVDASVVPRFAGIATFARLPRIGEVEHADIAVVGVQFDSGVSYRPGARFGPSHVREASRLLRPFNPAQRISPFAVQQVVDAGDIAVNPFRIEEAVEQVEAGARALAEWADRLVVIGGDHTIALPLLRAVADRHGPVAVLHFDAHLDTWDTYFGAPITHGTPFRRASEEGLIDLTASMHVGTRGPLYGVEDLTDDARLGFAIVTSEDIEEHGVAAAIERIRARIGDAPLYIS
ncbi:MAG TPA: arginase family protein, partial [Agromyces mariniharenae]|nr:arginase family protein [Agromyces mariniharenae]